MSPYFVSKGIDTAANLDVTQPLNSGGHCMRNTCRNQATVGIRSTFVDCLSTEPSFRECAACVLFGPEAAGGIRGAVDNIRAA